MSDRAPAPAAEAAAAEAAAAEAEAAATADPVGLLFDVDTFAVHDGPGIRMTAYLKGCPLACAWCHSPESRLPQPEILLLADRCAACGACVAACRQGVHALEDGRHTLDRARCRACGACVRACPQEALQMRGYRVAASAVVRRAVRLRPFFAHSGGGVTLTGGEVTLQPEFAEAILRGCREAGLATAIETSGACAPEVLERLLAWTDLVLYDLKLADDAAHRRWVGASNRATLENAARLATWGVAAEVRVPLIPGITDGEENLRGIYAFMREAGLGRVALLPYNEAAPAKYEWLGLPYPLGERARQSAATLASLAALARAYGLQARVDG